MLIMKGVIRYVGQLPRYALKVEWVNGSEMGIEYFFDLFKDRCPVTDKLDLHFVEWFARTYLEKMDSSEFEFDFDLDDEVQAPATDLEVEEITSPEQPPVEQSKVVVVESSSVATSSSLEEASKRLRAMRHPDEVGVVEHEEMKSKTNKLPSDIVRDQPKLGSNVLTGDDLAGRAGGKDSGYGLVLSSEGEASTAVGISKERKADDNARMASLSGRAKILIPEDIMDGNNKSRVMTGDNMNLASEQSGAVSKGFEKKVITGGNDKKKVNVNFAGYPTASIKREISTDDISRNPNEKDAIRLVNECKSPVILKVARIHCHSCGKTRLVEAIDARLREIPYM